MTTYVALLHSIVLGGGRRVVMSDLRATVESIGFRSPRTLVATGNLVFEADIIGRSAEDWIALAAGNPFSDACASEAPNIIVRAMRTPLSRDVLPGLQRHCTDGEKIRIVNGDLWIHFPAKPSTSKLVSALTTKRLGIGTLRNWNTVRGLRDMIGA
jgi:uncharacterized protein (DUF1697 family)